MTDEFSLSAFLETERQRLLGFLQREGAGLLRFESAEDLAQGVCVRALAAEDKFEYEGERAAWNWLLTLARRHLADRHDYWIAMRRGGGRTLRLTWASAPTDPLAQRAPVPSRTGPATFASRKEQLVLAARALSALSPRDRKLVRWSSEGLSLAEQAARLELSYEATQRASLRAQERFRKAYAALGPADDD